MHLDEVARARRGVEAVDVLRHHRGEQPAPLELDLVRGRLEAEPHGVPRCDCGDALKPDVVLFGELLPERALMRAQALAGTAGLLLCVGSSLEVYPVAELPEITLRAGGRIAIVTRSTTPYDADAALKLTGDVEEELEAVVAAL